MVDLKELVGRQLAARRNVLACALLTTTSSLVGAQSTLIGSVTSDSAGKHGIDGVQVSIAALKINVRTNADGIYIINGLTLGKYLVAVRAIGYKNLEDSVTIDAPDATERNFVLATNAQPLDPVVTTATRREYFSPMLRGFEDRRVQGIGHYISEEQLRKADNQRVSDLILPHFPGMKLVRNGNATSVASTRNSSFGKHAGAPPCYATVYYDGVLLYDADVADKFRPPPRPPNLDDYNVSQLAGVEFYGGEGSAPMGFKNSGCGLLLLWTRER